MINLEEFNLYFEQFGGILDSVIMKDRVTHQPRGFGFVTFLDPSSVDTVMKIPEHYIMGKLVDCKRAVP